MIVVVLGGSESLRDEVVSQLMQSNIALIRHFNITGFIHCKGVGLTRLKAEFERPKKMTNSVTIVSGISTNDELVYLRSKSAIICHCYGELTELYSHIVCANDDKYILPNPLKLTAPPHVYSPDEIVSECYIRG